MLPNHFHPEWYVLHTKSRFENVVYDGLYKKSIDVFLPKVRVRSRRKDRRVVLNVPLFPGYLFVKSDLHPERHLDILKTVGVVRLIGNKEGPISVSGQTIESLKIMVSVGDAVTTGNRLKKGDRVLVVRGPFTGIVGRFHRYKGGHRIIVNIEALGQFAGVEIHEEDVEPVPEIIS
ncbi:MAG: UpxY family transcription antiterminator [Desulfobacterales bacterium]